MTGSNKFLPFGTGSSPNVIDDAAYAALTPRSAGFLSGVAQSQQLNKVWRQSSVAAAVLGQIIANNGVDATDSDPIATLVTNLLAAIHASPVLTGDPKAPTPATTDNDVSIATTAFVKAVVASYAPLADPELTGNPTAPTAAQFDHDLTLATTEFVQRALGNFRDVTQYTNQTAGLNNTDVGRIIVLGGGSNDLTLPPVAGLPFGASFKFFSQGGSNIIRAPSGSVLAVGANTSNTSINLQGSEFCTVVYQTTNCYAVVDGSPMLPASAGFAHDFSTNGYQKLPGGMIIQWGLAYGVGGAPNASTPTWATVNFPITFPNTVLSIQVAPQDTYGPNDQIATPLVYTDGSNSRFLYGNTDQDSGIGNYRWFAIGY
jgi:hypothetical protein